MMRTTIAIATFVAFSRLSAQDATEGTFSIVARDPATGELGAAVQSKAFATGSRAISIKGGVAAIAHQASPTRCTALLGWSC